jgi:hypothetical protein
MIKFKFIYYEIHKYIKTKPYIINIQMSSPNSKTVAQMLHERACKVNEIRNLMLTEKYKSEMEKEVNKRITEALEEIEKAANQGLFSIEIFSTHHCELMDKLSNDERFSGLTLTDISDYYQRDGHGCVKISWTEAALN